MSSALAFASAVPSQCAWQVIRNDDRSVWSLGDTMPPHDIVPKNVWDVSKTSQLRCASSCGNN